MNIETILTSYQQVDRYYRLIAVAKGSKANPAVTLRGLDAFLMRQIAACHPAVPTVIDLAGAATSGASTLFWAAQGTQVRAVFAGRASWQPADPDWAPWMRDALNTLGMPPVDETRFLEKPLDTGVAWDSLAPQINALAPLLISVAGLGESVQEHEAHLLWLLSLRQNTLLLTIGVGETGVSPLIEAASHICSISSTWRLTLLREVSPFFATSDLALIYPRDTTVIAPVLKRLRDLYDGNFSFISLMESHYKYITETLKAQAQTVQVVSGAAFPDTVPVHRFFSYSHHRHFYTTNLGEMYTDGQVHPPGDPQAIYPEDDWHYEGIGFYVYPSQVGGSTPVYRFFSPVMPDHFYTSSEAEKDGLIANPTTSQWRYEGPGWYAPGS